MDRHQIEQILADSERAVDAGESPGPFGFWRAVAAVKRSPDLIADYADRLGAIDQQALRRWAMLVTPLWVGNLLAIVGSLAGLGLVAWAYYLDGTTAGVSFLVGLGALLVCTHGLAHLAVGMAVGMRFTSWFVGSARRPQPGVKVDLASYLRTPARSRAWMHASGVIVTKLLPWLLLGAALAAGLPGWVTLATVVIGVFALLTDVFLSTRFGEWRKVRRELGYARDV